MKIIEKIKKIKKIKAFIFFNFFNSRWPDLQSEILDFF